MSKRLSLLRKLMKKQGIDMIVLYNLDNEYQNPNVFYLSGFYGLGVLVLRQKGKPHLFVPKMYEEQANRLKGISVRILKKDFYTSVKKMLSPYRRKPVVGLDYFTTTLALRQKLGKAVRKSMKLVDVYALLSEMRAVKEEDEVRAIAKACEISDWIFKKFVRTFSRKRFRNEKDVKAFFVNETHQHGCEKAFDPIVASGKNASMPHYTANNAPLKKGFLLVDFGVRYKGYNSDTTRTFYLGKPSKKEKELYGLLLSTQKDTLAFIEGNAHCGEIEKYARESLGQYQKYFIHGLGHGVGIKIHELPNLLPDSNDVVKDNMIFTVEPGIYLPGRLGIRIEDTCVMKNGKVKRLTTFSKELISL